MKTFLTTKRSFTVSCKDRKRKGWICKMSTRNYFLGYKILTMKQMEMNMKNKLLQRGKDNILDEVLKQITNKRFWFLARVQDSLSQHSKKDRINQLNFFVSVSLIRNKISKNRGVHYKKITLYNSNNRVKSRVAIAEIPHTRFKKIWYNT